MIRPAQLGPVNQDGTQREKQQQRAAVTQARPPRPPPEEPTRQQREQRRNNRSGEVKRPRRYWFQNHAERDDEIIERRRRMRCRARGKILERMMPQNEARALDAHPHSRHPRIAIRVREINFAADENFAVIRAPRRQDQRGQENDLNSRDNGTSHPAVLIENPKSKIENFKSVWRWRCPSRSLLAPGERDEHGPPSLRYGVAAFAFAAALQSEGWAHQDSNLGPRDYESPALTAEL